MIRQHEVGTDEEAGADALAAVVDAADAPFGTRERGAPLRDVEERRVGADDLLQRGLRELRRAGDAGAGRDVFELRIAGILIARADEELRGATLGRGPL